jgi:hypothetical protein
LPRQFPEKDLTLDAFNIAMNAISVSVRLRVFFLTFSKNGVRFLELSMRADGQKSLVYPPAP